MAEIMSYPFPLSSPLATWCDPTDRVASWPPWPLLEPVPASPRDFYSSSSSSAAGSNASAVKLGSPQPLEAPIHLSSPSLPPPVIAQLDVKPPQARACSTPGSDLQLEQHRSAEAQRRRREKVLLRRLEELSAAEGERGDEQQLTGAASTSASTVKQKRQKRKRNKLSVLEASALRIERLERLLNAAELANRMSEAHVQMMSDEISSLVQRERQSMQWLASRALRGSAMLDERFAYTLMCCRTGRLLDANSNFFTITGFTPSNILQRVLDPILATPGTPATPLSDIPLVRGKRLLSSPSGVSGQEEQWVPLRPPRQYPGSVRLLQELLTGKRDTYSAPFRSRWADGCVYETHPTVWLGDVEWVEEANGDRWRRPLTFVCVAQIEDFCRVDEEEL